MNTLLTSKSIALLLSLISLVQLQGINFGSYFSKGAMPLLKKGFVMVEDSVSKTKTPAVISFCKDSRYFEYQSKGKVGRNFCTNFQFLNANLYGPDSELMKFYMDNQNIFRNQIEFKKDDYGYYYSVSTNSLPVIQGFTDLQENNPKEIDMRFETIYSMLIR